MMQRFAASLGRFRVRAPLACLIALTIAACTLNRPESVVPASYDLGAPPAYTHVNPGIPGTILVPPVRAPDWLDDTGIVYRLVYEDPAKTHVYAMSKWASEPAALVTDRLRARLAAVSKGVVAPGFG